MKRILLSVLVLIAFQGYGQWQYVNPTNLSSQNPLWQTGVVGNTGGNYFYNNTWLYGTSSTNDWTTTKLIDGISVDASFNTPATARSWWKRDAYNNIQSWGDMANTYLTINAGNVGIGTVDPQSVLSLKKGSNSAPSETPAIRLGYGGQAENRDGVIGSIDFAKHYDLYVASRIYSYATWSKDAWSGSELRFATATDGGNNTLSDRMTITNGGNVGIGTTSPDAKLTVTGQVHAQEVKVTVTVPGPDYVFEKDYKLTSLEEIKNYIDQNKHLPEVPSAKEMEKNGVQLGEMNMLLLKKIEELTLHMIELKKNSETEIKHMEKENQDLRKRLEILENKK